MKLLFTTFSLSLFLSLIEDKVSFPRGSDGTTLPLQTYFRKKKCEKKAELEGFDQVNSNLPTIVVQAETVFLNSVHGTAMVE